MGLGSRKGSGKNYLSIYGGSIVKEWRKEPKPEYIPEGKELKQRTLSMGKNAGNTVWFVEFDFLKGPVQKIVLDESGDWGSNIEIYINDVGEEYILNLKVDSSQGRDFLRKLENIDFSQDVCFLPWSMTPEEWFDLTGKPTKSSVKTGLSLRTGDEDGEKIESFYSKDDPKGLPELEQKTTRKGVEWNSDKQVDFLLDRLEAVIKEKFHTSGGTTSTPAQEPIEEGVSAPNDNAKAKPKGKGKLPF